MACRTATQSVAIDECRNSGIMHRVGAFALLAGADLVENDGDEHAAPVRRDDGSDNARLGKFVRLHEQLALRLCNLGDQQRSAIPADRRLIASGEADRRVTS
jgi:hypothetical protein